MMSVVVVQKWNQIQDVQTSTTVQSLVFKFHILSLEKKTNQIACFETPPPLILCIHLQTKTELQCLLFQEHEGCKVVGSWLEIVCVWTSNIWSWLLGLRFFLFWCFKHLIWIVCSLSFFAFLMFTAFDLDCLGWNCCLLFWTLDLCLLTLWRTLLSSSTTVQCSLHCRVVSKFVGRMVHWGFQVSILRFSCFNHSRFLCFNPSWVCFSFFFPCCLESFLSRLGFFCVCSSTALRFYVQSVYCRSLWSECVWERERALQEILDLFVVRVGESCKRLWIWCRSLVSEESSKRFWVYRRSLERQRECALQEIVDILYCKLKRIYESWYLLKGLIESLKEAYLLDWQKEEHDANLELWDGPKLKEEGQREYYVSWCDVPRITASVGVHEDLNSSRII